MIFVFATLIKSVIADLIIRKITLIIFISFIKILDLIFFMCFLSAHMLKRIATIIEKDKILNVVNIADNFGIFVRYQLVYILYIICKSINICRTEYIATFFILV